MSTIELHKLANENPIDSRMNELSLKYFNDAIRNKNPLVLDIMHEFKAFTGGRTLSYSTPLDVLSIHDIQLPSRNEHGRYGW